RVVARPRDGGRSRARRPAEGRRRSTLATGVRRRAVARIRPAGLGYAAVMPGEGTRLGAVPDGDGTVELAVWAPSARTLAVHTSTGVHPLECAEEGLHIGGFEGEPGDEYLFV